MVSCSLLEFVISILNFVPDSLESDLFNSLYVFPPIFFFVFAKKSYTKKVIILFIFFFSFICLFASDIVYIHISLSNIVAFPSNEDVVVIIVFSYL